jgi:TM2 domain-containing membrane protein YozV
MLVSSAKSPGLAAVLSFFWCGLGQIYNGQIGKGIAVGFAYLICWFLWILLIGIPLTLGLWIWGMVDAYQTAERMNREAPPPTFAPPRPVAAPAVAPAAQSNGFVPVLASDFSGPDAVRCPNCKNVGPAQAERCHFCGVQWSILDRPPLP